MPLEPRLLHVTDPWVTLDHPRDTTLRLVEEGVRLGVATFWADVRSIVWTPGGASVRAFRVRRVAAGRAAAAFELLDQGQVRVERFTRVLYRVDPPVDLAYLQPLLLLATPAGAGPEIVNPPAVLAGHGEKLEACFAADLMPPSVATCDWEALAAFGRAERATVAKPLNEAQSKGVELLRWDSEAEREAARAILARLTDEFRRPALLQRYLPAVLEGETRLWYLDGELLAVARKRPAGDSFRIDMDKGGALLPHEPSAREREAVPRIGARLAALGVRLAAVDLIDGLVTDCNFTSPGLIPSMEEVLGRNLARPIVERLAAGARAAARGSYGDLANVPTTGRWSEVPASSARTSSGSSRGS